MTIRCEKCGSPSIVVDSRSRKDPGVTTRRRKCKGCGFRWSTIEKKAAPVKSDAIAEGART